MSVHPAATLGGGVPLLQGLSYTNLANNIDPVLAAPFTPTGKALHQKTQYFGTHGHASFINFPGQMAKNALAQAKANDPLEPGKVLGRLRRAGSLDNAAEFKERVATEPGLDITVVRQDENTDKVNTVPEWSSKSEVAIDDIEQKDVRDVVKHMTRFFEFAQKFVSDHPVIKRLLPEGINLLNKQVVVILDYDPSPGDDDGYANAFQTRGRNGELIFAFGRPPREASDLFDVFRPVTQDATIPMHELSHGLDSLIAELFGTALEYLGFSGALKESWADVFALAAIQEMYESGRPMTEEQMKVGDVWLKKEKAALRHVADPGGARQPDHELGPDLQKPEHSQLARTDLAIDNMIENDRAGVHYLNSIYNYVGAKAVLDMDNGSALPAVMIRFGAMILAAQNGMHLLSVSQAAQLHLLSAYQIYGRAEDGGVHERVQQEYDIWDDAGIFDAQTPGAEEMIKLSGMWGYHS